MTLDKALLRSAGEQLKNAQRVLLASHLRPDGDAIGSLLGLGLALRAVGKTVRMISVDGVPQNLRHLQGSEDICKRSSGEFDLICILDCSELTRVGDVFNRPWEPDINIDHHRTNLNFARINLVDIGAVATTQIIAELLSTVAIPLPRPAADALLTGLITDSLGFQTANMSPQALRLAADLVEMGCDLHDLFRRAMVMRSYEAARLWGAGLSRLSREGGLVWTLLSMADREACGYAGRDDADLVNVLVSVDDAEIALIFLEQPGEKVKVSWRSRPGIDVSGLASHFGGGGHANAAGAEIKGTLGEVQTVVIEATRTLLDAVPSPVQGVYQD
jgi:phosphoesterase RecJ-like protein